MYVCEEVETSLSFWMDVNFYEKSWSFRTDACDVSPSAWEQFSREK